MSESVYYHRPLFRSFETTGVVWWFPQVKLGEEAAKILLESFCTLCGVEERDVALGWFHAKRSPLQVGVVSGWCIYDSTYGSLRLTQALAARFLDVVWEALNRVTADGFEEFEEVFWDLAAAVEKLRPAGLPKVSVYGTELPGDDWMPVIARGEKAIYFKADATEEVVIRDFRYTPKGLVYDLEPGQGWDTVLVPAQSLKPLNGVTRHVRWNALTGEDRPLEVSEQELS